MTKNLFSKNNLCLSVFLSVLICVFMPIGAEAAQLNLISQIGQEIAVGQQFQVDLILNTENEEINAVEGKVSFPEDLLELKEIRDGNSVINLWIERPSLNSKSYILYSGITPGGYVGEKGLIFSLIFQAKKEGEGIIEIADMKVLLNDGKGTSAELRIENLEFRIQDLGDLYSKSYILYSEDKDPPEPFTPEIAEDPTIFDGKWFLVFLTQDKGTGIAYYAIRETRREIKIKRETDAKWVRTESPYLLNDQELRSYIYVKAVDKAGNERIEIVLAKYPLKWYENWWNWGIIILGVIVLYIIGKILWKKSRNMRKNYPSKFLKKI